MERELTSDQPAEQLPPQIRIPCVNRDNSIKLLEQLDRTLIDNLLRHSLIGNAYTSQKNKCNWTIILQVIRPCFFNPYDDRILALITKYFERQFVNFTDLSVKAGLIFGEKCTYVRVNCADCSGNHFKSFIEEESGTSDINVDPSWYESVILDSEQHLPIILDSQQKPPRRNLLQSAFNARLPAPSLTWPDYRTLPADQMKRAIVKIFQKFVFCNNFEDGVDAFEQFFDGNCVQMQQVVLQILIYIMEGKQKSLAKHGAFLAVLVKKGFVTKQNFIDAVKFFYNLPDDVISRYPNVWFSLAEISNSLITEGCLQITDIRTEIPNKAFLDHITSINEILVDENIIPKMHSLDCLKTNNCDEVIERKIDENSKNDLNSIEFVSISTKIICESIFEQWQQECEQTESSVAFEDTIKKHIQSLKIYIDNRRDLKMKCLLAMYEYVFKGNHPRELSERILEMMFDMKLIS